MEHDFSSIRWHWEWTVKDLGFLGDLDLLWDSMIEAREQCSSGLKASELASSPDRLKVFTKYVRDLVGPRLSDDFIVKSLLDMPRFCIFCEIECAEWCEDCGGCPDCCDSEIHCIFCRDPVNICECPHCKCCVGVMDN